MRARYRFAFPLCLLCCPNARAGDGDAFGQQSRRPGEGPAVAHGPRGDGVYGRFDGDFAFSIGAGVELDFAGSGVAPRPLILGSARFYQTAGIYAGLSQAVLDSDRLERVFSTGVLLEPLFLLRWSKNQQTGVAVADLAIDSLSIALGAYFSEPRGARLADASGLELGLGFGLPLLGKAPGPWLRTRGQMRLGQSEPAALLHFVLEWQGFLESDLVRDD